MTRRRRTAWRSRRLAGLDRLNAVTALFLPPDSDDPDAIEAYVNRYLDLREDLDRVDTDGESWARAVLEFDVEPALEADPRLDLLYGPNSPEAELAAAVARENSDRMAVLARAELRRKVGKEGGNPPRAKGAP